jgi:hypothetical protein
LKKFLNICSLIIIIVACNDDKYEVGNNLGVTIVNYDIDSVTIWHKNWCYIIDKPDFKVNKSLTIQEKAIVKFNPVNGRSIEVTPLGLIMAQGVVFTSFYDDNHGGDSNKDGLKSVPAPSNWDAIKISGNNKSVFSNCTFLYSGGGDTSSTIIVRPNLAVELNGCTFLNNNGGSPENLFGVVNCRFANAKTQIKNNLFYNNSLPITINPKISIDNSNNFKTSAAGETNKYNAIFVDTWSDVMDSVIWLENKVPFVIMYNNLNVIQGKLSLGNGVCVKFNKNTGIKLPVFRNVTYLYNIDGPNVFFTSYFDDSIKGDSNGDGGQSVAQNGDWNGFTFTDSIPANYPWVNVKYIK